MMTQLATPMKYISRNEMRRVDSEQAIVPVTYQEQLEARLRQNTKIINMINSNRIERSRSRRKERLVFDEEEDKKSNKKVILDEIVSKLDQALRESKVSMESSKRRVHSETKELEEKVKAFQNSLKEVKQSNIETQQKINDIKNEMTHSKVVITTHEISVPSRSQLGVHSLVKDRERRVQTVRPKPQAKYEVKGHYIYPKYVRPETRYRNGDICYESTCRRECICGRK